MKRALCVILSLLLIAALMAGCNSTSEPPTNTPTPPPSTNGTPSDSTPDDAPGQIDYSEHETFTLWLFSTPADYYASYSDNPVTQYLNNKFNVTLEFEQPAGGTEADSLSLMFGTGEYTDMFETSYYPGSIEQLFADGVIINIADYLDYMPNYKRLLETDEMFRRVSYDDDGNITVLKSVYEVTRYVWGGLSYRRDILETMTGGYISFPSGNDEPSTVEDWEYMLPLFKAYFEAAGMTNSASLIIPAVGYFVQGQLANGFGISPYYYQKGGEVRLGVTEEGFYNYLKKMNEWYEAGYIYQDFASRGSDPFYFPNPELTYGGAAGIWFGMPIQLGDQLSMPEYGLHVEMRAMTDPLDTANGIEKAYVYSLNDKADNAGGYAVTSSCANIPKLLSVMDYLYSAEGSMLTSYGLSAEDAANDPVLQQLGLTDGMYTMEDGLLVNNPLIKENAIDAGQLQGGRFAGMYAKAELKGGDDPHEVEGDRIWSTFVSSEQGPLPTTLTMPISDSNTFNNNNTVIFDYVDSMVPRFIMGTEPLNDDTWNAFVGQLKAYGTDENIDIMQRAYSNFMAR